MHRICWDIEEAVSIVNLYYKYNARIRETNYWSERIVIINQLREDLDYLKMTLESQDKLFKELM